MWQDVVAQIRATATKTTTEKEAATESGHMLRLERWTYLFRVEYFEFSRRGGGTGRRSGLKIRRPSGLGGSTPPPGTKPKKLRVLRFPPLTLAGKDDDAMLLGLREISALIRSKP